jgi:hypothetical protein
MKLKSRIAFSLYKEFLVENLINATSKRVEPSWT